MKKTDSTKINMFRGHKIEQLNGVWIYEDTKLPTAVNYKNRVCGFCDKHYTKEGHDGCLGTLPNIINACCGHGKTEETYLQYPDKTVIRGEKAAIEIEKLKKLWKENI